MVIFQFHHHIKPELVEAYKEAVLENARETVKEEGVIAFQVFQDQKDPTHFSLLEIYRDAAGREFHLQQPCFLKFKETVIRREMFARQSAGDEFDLLFPEEVGK